MANKKPRTDLKMTDELFELICLEIGNTHEGLKTITKRHGTSSPAFFNAMDKDETKKKSDQYMRARERQADYLFDEQREVVYKRDEDHTPFTGGNVIQRDKLIAETLKWQAGKLRPKTYGDKIEVEQKTDVTVTFK